MLWLGKEDVIANSNGYGYKAITVCYHYRPKFIKDSYYREGHYGVHTTHLISKETHGDLKQVLDSLVTE